jgi:hypothetical protein
VTGTDTPLGHGGIAQAEALNAVVALGGRPVAVLRVSFADARERHRGVSHHSLTVLGRLALAPAFVAVPEFQGEQAASVDEALARSGVWERHVRVDMPGVLADTAGVPMRSMGRGAEDDPAFFRAAAAAGETAAFLLAR